MKFKVILDVDEARLKAAITDGMTPEEAADATNCSLEAVVHAELELMLDGVTVESMEEVPDAGIKT